MRHTHNVSMQFKEGLTSYMHAVILTCIWLKVIYTVMYTYILEIIIIYYIIHTILISIPPIKRTGNDILIWNVSFDQFLKKFRIIFLISIFFYLAT